MGAFQGAFVGAASSRDAVFGVRSRLEAAPTGLGDRPGAFQEGGGAVLQEAVAELGGQHQGQRVAAAALGHLGQLLFPTLEATPLQQLQGAARGQDRQLPPAEGGGVPDADIRDRQARAGQAEGLAGIAGQALQQGGQAAVLQCAVELIVSDAARHGERSEGA